LDREGDREAPALAADFLQRYLDDVRIGRARPLSHYQAHYPGHEALIAREYERLQSDSTFGTASLEVDPDFRPDVLYDHPQRIGPYRILESVGQGGMGMVYVAEQSLPIRRRVALKVIKLGMDTREVLARFESERQALALMNHPHIARVLDAGATEAGRPYFVMEYVPGLPLTRFCDEKRMPTQGRLELFLQLCDAVQHAHQKGIVHRDLKPSNVLVALDPAAGSGSGRPLAKIIDFGVAKSIHHRLSERTVYTEQGQILGTPEYMSPEQAEMGALDVDTRTDIYSLGVMLYELLAGVLPFDSRELRQASFSEVLRRIQTQEPLPPSTRFLRLGESAAEVARGRGVDARAVARQLRGDLDRIILKAMQKDRSLRYASASELAADLRRHLAHEPILAAPPSSLYRLRKFARRNRRALLAAAAALALAALGITAGTAWQRRSLARSMASRAEGFHREALRHSAARFDLKARQEELEQKWKEARQRHKGWEPIWERADELAAWEKLEAARQDLELHSVSAVNALQKAVEQAQAGSEMRSGLLRELERLYFERYLEAVEAGEVRLRPEFFKGMIESLGVGSFQRELEGGGRVLLLSDPPEAEVFCFRYEKFEERLIPLPFDPRRGLEDPRQGLLGGPWLIVEKVSHEEEGPFRAGDRLLQVQGQEVRLLGDLARILAATAPSQRLEAKVRRAGESLTLSWIPFPPSAAAEGREGQSLEERLGLTFTGYPLEFQDGARVGRTGAGQPLLIELPRGSYLLVLRKEGFRDARWPAAVPPSLEAETVRLLREEEIPPGFVHIPSGPVAYGGDLGVDESLDRGRRRLPDFLMARLEVTFREYLEFINDSAVYPEIVPGDGTHRRSSIALIPWWSRGLLFEREEEGRWKLGASVREHPDWPVFGIPVGAAREYAGWLTRKRSSRWSFRLPTDLEWEKAARGMDRRFYTWGNYLVWNFCNSHKGRPPPSAPAPVGSQPADESIYGVRDLAGSVMEPTADRTVDEFCSLRGGSWYTPTEYYYRIANRLGRPETARGVDQGLRLVADPTPGRSGDR
jgi:serine/threonine protein kinase/formylglycine-generating enzyme required for sulfatase activity